MRSMHTGDAGAHTRRAVSSVDRRSRRVWLVVAALVAALVSGCGVGSSVSSPPVTAGAGGVVHVPAGSSSQTIIVGGRSRSFHVYRPAALDTSRPVPLVVMLHGGFGDGLQAESTYGWDAEADHHDFVVVYPDGVAKAWNVDGGGCCGTPAKDHIDDVAFITRVVTTVQAELPIDPERVYATGISNGGIMSYRLACDTQLFAAIGPDSATLLGSCHAPSAVSVIHIHGTADTRIPYDGGMGSGAGHIDGPPVPSVVATWRQVDGCAAAATTTAGVVTTSIASCPDDRSVELITIAGAGHQWPGSKPKSKLVAALLGSDPPSTALDATDTIWGFFAAHPMP
jgi:polyhydroxybutyrate depolymerase